MLARRSTSASPASGSKRSRSPDTLEEAWRRQCKLSATGSQRAACRYAGCLYVPPKLREFAAGKCRYKADSPLKPMSSPDFEKFRADWEMHRRAKAAWVAQIGSTGGIGAPRAGEEEEEAEEGDDPLYLQAVDASKKDAAEAARAEEEEAATMAAAVKEMEAREAAARAPFFIRDE